MSTSSAPKPTPTATRARRVLAGLGTLLFFFLAPGFVAGLVPWWITRWRMPPPSPVSIAASAAGVLLAAAGLAVLVEAFWRFATKGLGTPAPVMPTRHLVVTGLYRRVRNPMYLAVTAILLGQALLFGSLGLLEYAAVVWVLFHFFVLAYEEPTLEAAHPLGYAEFRANVPRWIPRRRPWRPEADRP